MSSAEVDRLYMLAAVGLAEKALYSVTRNNPRVGCLLVNDGNVIGRGWHASDGGRHAEVAALDSVNSNAELEGSTVYVTLEPCGWAGRTGACTDALTAANVKRVVVGQEDPHPNVRGQGLKRLRESGIETRVLNLHEVESLNPGQRMRHEHHRPWIRIKSAISMDGRISMASGESQWITGTEARRDVQGWRARSGAILTGIGTVLHDDPQLTVRDERFPDSNPMRVICDSNARIPEDARILESEAEVLIATCEGIQPTKHAEHIRWTQHGQGKVDLRKLLNELADNGVNELLVEAGSSLVSELFQHGLWDEWIVYIAPKLLGSTAVGVTQLQIGQLSDSVQGKVTSVTTIGTDVRVRIHRAS